MFIPPPPKSRVPSSGFIWRIAGAIDQGIIQGHTRAIAVYWVRRDLKNNGLSEHCRYLTLAMSSKIKTSLHVLLNSVGLTDDQLKDFKPSNDDESTQFVLDILKRSKYWRINFNFASKYGEVITAEHFDFLPKNFKQYDVDDASLLSYKISEKSIFRKELEKLGKNVPGTFRELGDDRFIFSSSKDS